LNDGSRGDDRIGYSHVLLVEPLALSSHLRCVHSQAGLKIVTSDDAADLGRWLREHGIIAALVRPDRYVRGAARNDAELDRLINAVITQTHVPSAA